MSPGGCGRGKEQLKQEGKRGEKNGQKRRKKGPKGGKNVLQAQKKWGETGRNKRKGKPWTRDARGKFDERKKTNAWEKKGGIWFLERAKGTKKGPYGGGGDWKKPASGKRPREP